MCARRRVDESVKKKAVKICLTPLEHLELQDRAKRAGKTLSQYLVMVGLHATELENGYSLEIQDQEKIKEVSNIYEIRKKASVMVAIQKRAEQDLPLSKMVIVEPLMKTVKYHQYTKFCIYDESLRLYFVHRAEINDFLEKSSLIATEVYKSFGFYMKRQALYMGSRTANDFLDSCKKAKLTDEDKKRIYLFKQYQVEKQKHAFSESEINEIESFLMDLDKS